MPLPKLTAPRFTIELPSDNKKISFRPFLVKEEKNLLIASESKDIESMISSISDIINSCVLEENFDAMKLCSFDFEYLFLNIRAKSIGEKIKLRYRHRDGKNYKGEDCNEIAEVEMPGLMGVRAEFGPKKVLAGAKISGSLHMTI
jgi:hypothetical protein